MKLIDAMKESGAPFVIPESTRLELPSFFVEMGYKIGVEIGVYKAENTEQFCKAGLQIYGVDPWLSYEDHIEGRQAREDFLYEHAQRVIAPYPNCTLIRKKSMDAVDDFKNSSLDFVYIDGNHGFKYIAEDLWEWSKKVRKGGVISGHDYGHVRNPHIDPSCFHVQCAVDGYVKAMDIQKWYVLGGCNRGDRWKSFMWVK